MKATERTLHEIINSPDHYLIPFFQRYYSWKRENWTRLWDDLCLLVDAMSEPEKKRPRTRTDKDGFFLTRETHDAVSHYKNSVELCTHHNEQRDS